MHCRWAEPNMEWSPLLWCISLKYFSVAEAASTVLDTLPLFSLLPLQSEAYFIFFIFISSYFILHKLLPRQAEVKAKAHFLFYMLLWKEKRDSSVVGYTAILELFFVIGLHFLRIVSSVTKLGKELRTHLQLWRKGLEGTDEVRVLQSLVFCHLCSEGRCLGQNDYRSC